MTCSFNVYESTDADLVRLKISLLDDCQIRKTSFMTKYVGDEQEEHIYLEMVGVSLMDKTLIVQGARISFNLWDVGGNRSSLDHVPIACKDAVVPMKLTSTKGLAAQSKAISDLRRADFKKALPNQQFVLVGVAISLFLRLCT